MISLRHRIVLTLLPPFVLLAIVGGYGAMLLYRIGGRIDEILRENYRSVIYMQELKENLERMDSSFQFAMAGRETEAEKQYRDNWQLFGQHLDGERHNITLPGEQELVSRLSTLSEKYHAQGDDFFAKQDAAARQAAYFGQGDQPGLLGMFKDMKTVANQVMRLNQDNMESANREARETAASSLLWFGTCLGLVAFFGVLLARRNINTILRPIKSVTQSVQAIGAGNLDQVVPSVSSDELGELAIAVNTMARQLRDYRQSQKARLLRIQQAAQATVDSFPDPVLVVDPECLVEMANPAAKQVLGLGFDESSPDRPQPWGPPESLRGPLTEALQKQRPYLPEGFDHAISLHVDSAQRYFLPRVLPIKDPYGGMLGAAVLLADVTRFQLLDQVKSDLVATVSHELKTPLSSVSMAIHLMLEEAVGPLTPKQTELLLEARASSERLLSMINNLLDLARLEKGSHLEISPEKPARLLQAAADMIRQRAEDQDVELVVDAPLNLPLVAVDVRVLNHALRNLLDNALAYTDRRGKIILAATAENDSIVLTVSDTGSGIPPDYLPHVFDRFFRVPGQSHGGGTGLGLAIVREIAVAHGGGITCTSQPGVGTTFRLTLPVWHENAEKNGALKMRMPVI